MITNKQNVEKLEDLMNTYGDTIFRTCYMYLSDYSLAEDATQETFIKAMRSLDKFKGNASEKTWLVSIAINTCKNIYRTNWFKRKDSMVSIEDMDKEACENANIVSKVEDFADSLVSSKCILEQIKRLSVKDRTMIILYYYQELTAKEIGEMMKLKENSVLQSLKRARKRLKELLKEAGYEASGL